VLAPFLTSYDPSDLPGGSIDPLGFDRGYIFLADQILPGLTNAAGRPRYFSMMCAATQLAPEDGRNDREKVQVRTHRLLLLERFWATANVLASGGPNGLDASGIRGVTFAEDFVARMDPGVRTTDADFKMLAVQSRYGAVGIYANVASRVSLLDRKTMLPTRDLGRKLADAFIEETRMPARLRGAIRAGSGDVPLSSLTEWGETAHIAAAPQAREADYLAEAFNLESSRLRLGRLLSEVPAQENEPELARLRRLRQAASAKEGHLDLVELIDVIIAFEASYRVLLLLFERLLWLCKDTGSITPLSAARDAIVSEFIDQVATCAGNLEKAVARCSSEGFRKGVERLHDVHAFIRSAATTSNTQELLDVVLSRHSDVQYGKFDRGRRKLPWIQRTSDRYDLVLSGVGEVRGGPKSPEDIRAHEYRIATADRLLAAGAGQSA
jgi:hypothetical protein